MFSHCFGPDLSNAFNFPGATSFSEMSTGVAAVAAGKFQFRFPSSSTQVSGALPETWGRGEQTAQTPGWAPKPKPGLGVGASLLCLLRKSVQPPTSSVTTSRIICKSLRNLWGTSRPFLVVASFSLCHFNTNPTSKERKYPPSGLHSFSSTNDHSYKVEHCKTSCAYIFMYCSTTGFSSNLDLIFHGTTNDLPKAMCSEATGLLSLMKV